MFLAMGIEKESSFCYSATLSGRREQHLFAIQVKKYISSNLPRTCRVAIMKSSLFIVLEVSAQLKLSNVLVRSVQLEISFSYYLALTRTLTTLTVNAASPIHHKFLFITCLDIRQRADIRRLSMISGKSGKLYTTTLATDYDMTWLSFQLEEYRPLSSHGLES
jgi:hypothetical protein